MSGQKRAAEALRALESILDGVGVSTDDICWVPGPVDQTRRAEIEDALNEKLGGNPVLVILIWSKGTVVVTGKKLLLEVQHVRDILEEAAGLLGVASFDVGKQVREMVG